MIGFSLKDFLPPRPTPAAETAVPKDNPPRKRKAVERGSSSQPEGGAKIQEIPRSSPLSGPSPPSQPRMMLLGNVLDPSAIPRDAVASGSGNDLVWAPSFEVFGEAVRSSAAILPMGDGMGAKVASSLCQAARLPTDMAEWKRSTNPKVIDNLRRGLMMVRIFPLTLCLCSIQSCDFPFVLVCKGFRAPWS